MAVMHSGHDGDSDFCDYMGSKTCSTKNIYFIHILFLFKHLDNDGQNHTSLLQNKITLKKKKNSK